MVVHPYSPDDHLPGHAQAHMIRNDTLETIDKGINTCQAPKDARTHSDTSAGSSTQAHIAELFHGFIDMEVGRR